MSKVTSLIRWRHAPPQELADGLSSAPAACRLDHMIGGVSACDAGSRRLRDSIRCSVEMLRQIRAGVKLSIGISLHRFPGTNVKPGSAGNRVNRDHGSWPS